MSTDITDMPGIEAAMERFSAVDNTPAPAAPNPTDAQATRDLPANAAQPTANGSVQNSDPKPSDTRAAAENTPAAPSTVNQTVKETPPQASADANKSRYAKSQERLTKTWEQVNADKTAFAAERTKFEAERAELARQRAEFDTIRQQAQQPQFKPEDYLQASAQKRQLADHQRAESKRLEDQGKFAEAERLTKLASKNDALADDLAEHAEVVRKNPPQGFAQREQQYQAAKQAWTVEAAKQFPDLTKDGSEFQKGVVTHLQSLAKSDPQLAAHPAAIFHASRLTNLEMQVKALNSEAARVPVLVKESESLRARIKELEALTTPAGGGNVPALGNPNGEDDAASLRQAAMEQGSIFR
ncbi:MAG: hypothetical protein KGJ13_06870 [Patescibacteria group bacterium]|nr:hypothetical protein [Patescibacteria group bacterium]